MDRKASLIDMINTSGAEEPKQSTVTPKTPSFPPITEILGVEVKNTVFQCVKCRSPNVTWEHKRRRRADEGADTDFTCLACGCTWTIRG